MASEAAAKVIAATTEAILAECGHLAAISVPVPEPPRIPQGGAAGHLLPPRAPLRGAVDQRARQRPRAAPPRHLPGRGAPAPRPHPPDGKEIPMHSML